jgi:hypothetical protein
MNRSIGYGIGMIFIGLVIAEYGINKIDALIVTVGAVLISTGFWLWQSAEMKIELNKVKKEIKEEIRKLGKQSKKQETRQK